MIQLEICKVGVWQDSVLVPFFFLICINDAPQGLISNVKHFSDDTSLFLNVNCAKTSLPALYKDLLKHKTWHINGKCHLIQTGQKKYKKLYLWESLIRVDFHLFTLTMQLWNLTHVQKHLYLQLDNIFSFRKHINNKISKGTKGVGLLCIAA